MKAITGLMVLLIVIISVSSAWGLTIEEQWALYYYYTTPGERMEGKLEEPIKQNRQIREDMLQQEQQIEELERGQQELRYDEHYRQRWKD